MASIHARRMNNASRPRTQHRQVRVDRPLPLPAAAGSVAARKSLSIIRLPGIINASALCWHYRSVDNDRSDVTVEVAVNKPSPKHVFNTAGPYYDVLNVYT